MLSFAAGLSPLERDWRDQSFDGTFVAATKEILHLWTVEQDHKNSPYRFVRDTDRREDTLVNDGFGPAFAVTGMTWSAFRPSDDCCQYSYLIPSNMFAVVVLGYVQEIFAELNLADSEKTLRVSKRRSKKASKITPTQPTARVKRFTPLKWMV